MPERDEILRASEVGQYAYCARAWWLGRVMGYRSTNLVAMTQGTERHRAHGRGVERAHWLLRVAVMLMLLAAVLLATWFLLSLGT